MRSMFMLAALAAVIGFTGCCGAGGGRLGGGLGAGKGVLNAGAQASSASTGDCGCSSGQCSSGGCGASDAAACACGADSTVSISAPYACDGGCGEATPMSAPSSCGCSSCDGGGAVEYAPAEHVPVQSSGCSACDSASTGEPVGLFTGRDARKEGLGRSGRGLGLSRNQKGLACAQTRSLRTSADSSYVMNDHGVSAGGCGSCENCDTCSAGVEQTVAQMPDGYQFGNVPQGRRISTGIISDIREVKESCGLHGCGKRGCRSGHCGGGDGSRSGKLPRVANAAGVGGHPYGGVVPHTNPAVGQQPQSGIAPQYAYPYYTTRGPRDFLRDNPPSIGY